MPTLSPLISDTAHRGHKLAPNKQCRLQESALLPNTNPCLVNRIVMQRYSTNAVAGVYNTFTEVQATFLQQQAGLRTDRGVEKVQ